METNAPTLRPARPDEPFCAQATDLVNAIYTVVEHPLWQEGRVRTDLATMQACAAAGELLLALDGDQLLGCVVVHVDGDTAGFGPLVVDPQAGGRGIGGALVRAAEAQAAAQGAARMEIEVLRPATRSAVMAQGGTDETRARLARWYPSLGYRFTETIELAAKFPQIVDDLAHPAVLDLYERPLTQA